MKNLVLFRRILSGYVVIVTVIAVPALMVAAPIAVQNASFETPLVNPQSAVTPFTDPIPGWVTSPPSNAALWDPGINSYNLLVPPAPAGNQIAYVGIFNSNSYLSQVLSENVQPNTLYTLTGYAAGVIGFISPYTISLRAGANELASVTTTPPTGTFAPFSLTFDSTASPAVGLPLEVRLLSTAPQTAFDDIRLDGTTIPEPSTFYVVVVGCIGLLLFGKVGVVRKLCANLHQRGAK